MATERLVSAGIPSVTGRLPLPALRTNEVLPTVPGHPRNLGVEYPAIPAQAGH